jgi:hypothetical protein
MPLSYTVEKQYIFSILIVLGIFMSCNHVQAAKPQLTTCVVKSRLQPMATSKHAAIQGLGVGSKVN